MTATFYVGDAIEVMNRLPEKSVDLILTSPPFLALRSYLPADHPDKALEGGSQSTPGEYIDWLLDVVEACARVLAPHGSLCFELGDTYSGSGGAGGDYAENGLREGGSGWPLAKSLSLIPESFRWAMVYGHNPFTGRRTEPWRLRNVIRWVRPNPPVGALGDKFRPATSELMVFCKAKDRFFDLDAVREPWTSTKDLGGYRASYKSTPEGGYDLDARIRREVNGGAPPLDWWNIPLLGGEEETRYGPKNQAPKEPRPRNRQAEPSMVRGGSGVDTDGWHRFPNVESSNPGGAPPLDWWNIPPGGYPGAHYAVWSPELLIKPIKAMCPEKVCRVCGEPSRRISDVDGLGGRDFKAARTGTNDRDTGLHGPRLAMPTITRTTLGFSDCGHDDWRPGLVLDPFGGSGTTALVATGHGRDCWLIDLDARNYDLALDRVGPFLLERG